MKKLIFLFALIGLCFTNIQNTNAQNDFSVTVEWTDYNCECSEPYTEYVRVMIYDYPSGTSPFYDSDWEESTSNPWTVYGNDEITDCAVDCYMVKAWVKYEDSSGECCTGYIQETCTGEELCNGFTFTLVMTME